MTQNSDHLQIPFAVHCDRCGGTFEFQGASKSNEYFFLVGKDQAYFGFNCIYSNCKNTILIKSQRKPIENIKNNVLSLTEEEYSNANNSFGYHSFPYDIDYHSSKPGACSYFRTAFLDGNNTIPEDRVFPYPEDDPFANGEYSSYFFDDPIIGPAATIWWFPVDDIENLRQVENKTGIKVFPRYIFGDPLFTEIENFCWSQELELLFYQTIDPRLTIYDLFKDSSRKAIERNYRFLKILCIWHERDITPKLIPSRTSLIPLTTTFYDQPSEVSKLIRRSDVPSPPDSIPISQSDYFYTHREMAEKLWDHFNKDYLQNLLSRMSSNFIADYIKTSTKIQWTYNAVWELKTKYLCDLYDSVGSKHKRLRVRTKVSKKQFEKIRKIEKQFPALKKIVSQDDRINEIKIKIAKYGEYESHYKEVKLEPTDILLVGDTGTGKELFANAINEASGRDKKKFVATNCAAIPKDLFESVFFGHEKGAFTDAKQKKAGYFEQAEGGTLFLDEFGELDIDLQGKLLRVVQNREFQCVGGKTKKMDVKIIFATNRDLSAMVKKRTFRNDLYFRIKRIEFKIPLLKERKGDIPLLVKHFIKKHDLVEKKNPDIEDILVSNECMSILEKYPWPGNVRELEGVIWKIIEDRLSDNDRSEITESDLPDEILDGFDSTNSEPVLKKKKKKKPEDNELISLRDENWTHAEIAKKYGVVRETVTRWFAGIKMNSI